MTDTAFSAERFAFTSQALSTLGTDPAWDAALSRYLRLESLTHADAEFGAYAKANEADDLARLALEEKYGKAFRSNPEAAEKWGALHERMNAAERTQLETYVKPMWEAGRRLALTPAPTLAAAVFKGNFIHREEIWNDNQFEADAMAIVTADFARLAGEPL